MQASRGDIVSAMRMPFGKHKGERISTLPDEYLEFLLTIELRAGPLRATIMREAEERGLIEHATAHLVLPPDYADEARRIVEVGFKRLAQQMHPDRGGSTEGMQRLNRAVELLRSALR
jgi:uncharacterized protein (DUF3820 family)